MRRAESRPFVAVGAAFFVYLALSVLLWWQVWSTHPTSVTTCGCGDTALFLWFIEWPAYAIAHGHNPFFSTSLFHPGGIDLLSNTSVLAVGIPLAPVTWLFGPVATLNVASTLAPALSATSMFWLLRRWVTWTPAAFTGGLLFGFSTFAVVNLAGAHLMTGVLVLLPLIVACLDEILVRQRRGAMKVGAALGLLVAVQFFVSTEVLAISAVCALVALVMLAGYSLVHRVSTGEDVLRPRLPHAIKGLGTGALCSGVLLAYPLWFALDGPSHLSGLVWPMLQPGAGSAGLTSIFELRLWSTSFERFMRAWGGYQGPRLPLPEFVGIGATAVAGLSLLIWRRDRRLWFFGALGLFTAFMSLGYRLPWRLLAHVPVLQNVVSGRFEAVTSLCVAVVVAVAADRTRTSVSALLERLSAGRGLARAGPRFGATSAARRRLVRLTPSVCALGVCLVAAVPVGDALSSNVPVTATTVALPRWYAEVGPHLAPGEVVLAYPAPFTVVQSAMAWQAVDLLRFAMVGGGGPGGTAARAGRERPGYEVVGRASLSLVGPPPPTVRNVVAVRSALREWGVTTIVVPDQVPLPLYDRGTNVGAAIDLFRAATGRQPRRQAGAWVWPDVGRAVRGKGAGPS